MAPGFNSSMAALALAALALAGTAGATTAPDKPPPTGRDCFISNSWQGWSAPGNGDFLYLRVGMHDIYRVDLTPGTHVYKAGDRFLINRVHGPDWICSPLDLQLTLADPQGYREPLIARSLRKLTAEEVAAIPRKDLP